MSEENEQFVSKSDHDAIVSELVEKDTRILDLTNTVNQLREALKQINAGITKASEHVNQIAEAIKFTEDQKLITDIAISLRKHRPKMIAIKYKGDYITEIWQEGSFKSNV